MTFIEFEFVLFLLFYYNVSIKL